jgi:hypothetical protein
MKRMSLFSLPSVACGVLIGCDPWDESGVVEEEEEITTVQPCQADKRSYVKEKKKKKQYGTRVSDSRYDSRIGWIWQVSCEKKLVEEGCIRMMF